MELVQWFFSWKGVCPSSSGRTLETLTRLGRNIQWQRVLSYMSRKGVQSVVIVSVSPSCEPECRTEQRGPSDILHRYSLPRGISPRSADTPCRHSHVTSGAPPAASNAWPARSPASSPQAVLLLQWGRPHMRAFPCAVRVPSRPPANPRARRPNTRACASMAGPKMLCEIIK